MEYGNQIGITVVKLGLAQTLAWASSYYLLALLAVPIARDLGIRVSTVFAAFSLALVVSAFLGPVAGRHIDRWGGRLVLASSNVIFAAGLITLGFARGTTGLFLAWVIIGISMGSGLYEAAFSTLVRLYGQASRNAITGVTLFAGFASTIGWPLSSLLEGGIGWRGTCLAWAGLHLTLGLALNLLLPKVSPNDEPSEQNTNVADAPKKSDLIDRPNLLSTLLLTFVFAATWFVSTAMASHLPRLLVIEGATLAGAVAAASLVGPAQVAGRLLEYGLLRHTHPLLSARLATLAHPIGVAALLIAGAPLAFVFALLHGLGNGILTIAMGTLPLALFGPQGYGQRQAILMIPARIAQAGAPLLFGLGIERWHDRVLWGSAGLGVLAFIAMLMLRANTPRR